MKKLEKGLTPEQRQQGQNMGMLLYRLIKEAADSRIPIERSKLPIDAFKA